MVTFRRMTETDVFRVAELEKNIFSDAWSERGLRDTLGQKQAFVTVAEEENEIVGYCIIYYAMTEAEIARIAVAETMRRKGVGCGLLDAVRNCCKEMKVERLLLDVRESNDSARSFYQKYGFVEDGVRKGFYEQPKENAVLMSKMLN